MRWAGHWQTQRMKESVRGFGAKPEGKRPLGRPRRRLDDAIRMDLRETGWAVVDWIRLAQDRDRWRDVNATFGFLRGEML
jgi:hypothetical protein